jgi:predicted NAD-dependent protein-ADP-ribosyltransferase YbiA (DUF1768 family)
VVSGVGEQELHTEFDAAFKYLEEHTEIRDVLLSGGDALLFSDNKLEKILSRLRAIRTSSFSASARACRSFCRSASRRSSVRCCRNTIRSG